MEYNPQQLSELVCKVIRQMRSDPIEPTAAGSNPTECSNLGVGGDDHFINEHPGINARDIYRENPVVADNPVLETISSRRSIRGYRPEQITGEQLAALLKAAEESPSAHNAQPWHFSAVQNRTVLAEINAEISKAVRQDVGDVFYGAPTVIFISINPNEYWARIDAGIAVQTIALAACSLGLGSVILAFPDAAFSGPRRSISASCSNSPGAIVMLSPLPLAFQTLHRKHTPSSRAGSLISISTTETAKTSTSISYKDRNLM